MCAEVNSAPKCVFTTVLGFALGVPLNFMEYDARETPPEVLEACKEDNNLVILRRLCILRNQLYANVSTINSLFEQSLTNIDKLPELFSVDCIKFLDENNIRVVKANAKVSDYLESFNTLVKENVVAIDRYIPSDIPDKDWVRSMFYLKKTSPTILKQSTLRYSRNISQYPFQAFISLAGDNGHMLLSDVGFLLRIFECNGQVYEVPGSDGSIGMGADPEVIRARLGAFLAEGSDDTIFEVDTENTSPLLFEALLAGLTETERARIKRVVLHYDCNAPALWKGFADRTGIPTELNTIERILPSKSILDGELIANTCKSYYTEAVAKFIIVSSDCDFWSLITSMPNAKLMSIINATSCSMGFREALSKSKVPFLNISRMAETSSFKDNWYKLFVGQIITELNRYNIPNLKTVAEQAAKLLPVLPIKELEGDSLLGMATRGLSFAVYEDGKVGWVPANS